MKINKVHCLFEQSGTFKKEFISLGVPAVDYDILNDFGQTDNVIDLYAEIEKAYGGGISLFDSFSPNELLIAFFPCVRFEVQIIMNFKGINSGIIKWDTEKKLEYDLKLHNELSHNYELITKLALICLKRKLRLIIENPYSTQHYLTRYWALEPKIIDTDRREMGDHYKKPTQYWFINCEPENNFIFEAVDIKKKKSIIDENTVDRSMIAPDYANRFIREFILDERN